MNQPEEHSRYGLGRLTTAVPKVAGLGRLQNRIELVTEAQHADLQDRIAALAERIEGVEQHVTTAAADTTTSVTAFVKAENVELVRMLRQQGDAADEVAEVLGRTLARLGAEVETLAKAVERLEARLDRADAGGGGGGNAGGSGEGHSGADRPDRTPAGEDRPG